MKKQEKDVDVKKIIKDLAKSYGDSNEDQGKMVSLLRGLAFSDDDAANKFMKALDKWTTEYADKNVKENNIEIKREIIISQGDETIILEKGDRIEIITEMIPNKHWEESIEAFFNNVENFEDYAYGNIPYDFDEIYDMWLKNKFSFSEKEPRNIPWYLKIPNYDIDTDEEETIYAYPK